MKTINRYFFLTLLTFGIIISTAPITMAQTPDGETPAVEEVCDGLEGKAYGLCNAYCEAKDCEEAAEETGHSSCQRLKENYFDLTGEDFFPCECEVNEEVCDGEDNNCDGDVDEGCGTCFIANDDRSIYAAFYVTPGPNSGLCNQEERVYSPFDVPEGWYYYVTFQPNQPNTNCTIANGPMTEDRCAQNLCIGCDTVWKTYEEF
jgi:hypothetical protein